MSLVRFVCRCGRFLEFVWLIPPNADKPRKLMYVCELCNDEEQDCHCKPIVFVERIER